MLDFSAVDLVVKIGIDPKIVQPFPNSLRYPAESSITQHNDDVVQVISKALCWSQCKVTGWNPAWNPWCVHFPVCRFCEVCHTW